LETATVTFVQHKAWPGVSQKTSKPYVRNVFTDTAGLDYSTLDEGLASQLVASLNQPVSIAFDTQQNGQYTNRYLKSVNGAAAPSFVQPPTTTASTATLPTSPDTRQKSINYWAALGRAIDSFAAAGLDPVSHHSELRELTELYLSWADEYAA